MDSEIKDLLQKLVAANEKKSPIASLMDYIKPILIAFVVAVPSVLITSTKYVTNFENRMQKQEELINQRSKDINFNFDLIKEKDKTNEYKFIKLE